MYFIAVTPQERNLYLYIPCDVSHEARHNAMVTGQRRQLHHCYQVTIGAQNNRQVRMDSHREPLGERILF